MIRPGQVARIAAAAPAKAAMTCWRHLAQLALATHSRYSGHMVGDHHASFGPALLFTVAVGACLPGVSATASPRAHQPPFRPETLKGPPPGVANEVVVLGTPHLDSLPDSFTPAMLAPLLDRLSSWRPTAIATENLSGLQCDSLRRYPLRYAETVAAYCPDPGPAARATGLDVPAANAQAERLLAAWPAQPTAAQRRQLAAVFLAAGEAGSALVQWLRLPAAQRHAGDGLTGELASALDMRKNRRDETSLIAAALAARLGLERLWSIDDHSADTPAGADPVEHKAYAAAIAQAWDNAATRARQTAENRLHANLARPGGLLDLYRALNAPDTTTLVYRSDFGAALGEPSRQEFGRQYVGYWETRNLRMVANIRDVLGRHPGTRMLAIVGASHRGYCEAYLNQMHDVTLIDANALLRRSALTGHGPTLRRAPKLHGR